jgi:Domain of unknown function (DUF1851)
MVLTVTPSPQEFERALESWAWIGLEGKRPLFASLFGDVFFEAADGIWYLSQLDGTLTHEWADRAALDAALATEEGQDRYLLGGLVIGARKADLVLGPGEVYDFVPPPILGGPIAVENLTVMDFVVSVHIGGQLHDQVRHQEPGTPISELRFEGPARSKRRWLFRRS